MEARVSQTIQAMADFCRKSFTNNITEEDFYDNCYTPIREKLPFSTATDHGISKGVILIEGAQEVIKIPFTGYYDDDYYAEQMNDYEYEQERIDCGEEIENPLPCPEYEDFYYDFEEAYTPEIDGDWDYCALECAIYADAEREHLDEYFAREYLAAKIENHPIYVQTRAVMFDDANTSSRHSKERLSKASASREKNHSPIYNAVWIADFIDYYGEDEFQRLTKFLKKHQLTDFHEGNLGYINEVPVLVDYSSFNS